MVNTISQDSIDHYSFISIHQIFVEMVSLEDIRALNGDDEVLDLLNGVDDNEEEVRGAALCACAACKSISPHARSSACVGDAIRQGEAQGQRRAP